MKAMTWFKLVYLNHKTWEYETEELQFSTYKEAVAYGNAKIIDGLQLEYITL